MLGIGRLRRLIERIVDPKSFYERAEEEHLEKMMGFRGQYRAHRDFQLALLKRLGLAPGNRLLEVGCGPLTLAVPIIDYLESGNYCGVDVRPLVLNLAYGLIGKNGLAAKNPRLLVSSTFGQQELSSEERFDFIVAFSVLYHLEDSLVEQLFQQVARRVGTHGIFVANVNVEHEPSRWLEFPFMQRPLSFYQDHAAQHGLTMEVLGQGVDLGMSGRDLASKNYYLTCRHQA